VAYLDFLKIRLHETIISPLVFYGCETWSLALREEHRLRVFENRMLRRILRHKREEVAGGWRRLHNEELHNLYTLPVKEDEIGGHVDCIHQAQDRDHWWAFVNMVMNLMIL
jgi:hypothetical protein